MVQQGWFGAADVPRMRATKQTTGMAAAVVTTGITGNEIHGDVAPVVDDR